jgi:phosphoribosylanthranilate isomerase
MRCRIKICGITTREDAEFCARCGADAIGFVFAESRRRISTEEARAIVLSCEPYVTPVGVFVDRPVEEVMETLVVSGCRVAQLHGQEPPSYIEALSPYPVVKAIRVGASLDEDAVRGYKGARAILLDTYVPGVAGGTGQRFDPAVARRLVQEGWRVILAGGLTPENVGEAVSLVRPYAVDASSGVESQPGRKDPVKVAAFIAAVRAADGGAR